MEGRLEDMTPCDVNVDKDEENETSAHASKATQQRFSDSHFIPF